MLKDETAAELKLQKDIISEVTSEMAKIHDIEVGKCINEWYDTNHFRSIKLYTNSSVEKHSLIAYGKTSSKQIGNSMSAVVQYINEDIMPEYNRTSNIDKNDITIDSTKDIPNTLKIFEDWVHFQFSSYFKYGRCPKITIKSPNGCNEYGVYLE